MASTVTGYVATAAGKPLEKQPIQLAPLGDSDVELKITHCGICHSDIHLWRGDWGPMSSFPQQVCGHEIVGEVSQVGAHVKRLKLGQRVGVGWYRDACGSCEACLDDSHAICPKGAATCANGNKGGFADAIRVPEDYAFPIPDALPSAAAAPLLCGGITVYAPLAKYAAPGKAVGIMGLGGLGSMGVQFAKARGNVVTAISTTPSKEELARSLGAHKFLVSTDKEQMKAHKDSLDVLLMTATANVEYGPFFDLLKRNGTIVFLGATSASIPVHPFMHLIGKQIKVTGSSTGGRKAITEMLKLAADLQVLPLIEEFPADSVNEAFEKVEKNQVRFRAVLKF
jgi:uncharacterized zinc-type alcohol dehydrogenase-like protein